MLLPCLVTTLAVADSLSRTNLLQYLASDGSVREVRSTNDWNTRRQSVLLAMQEVMGRFPGAEKRCALDLRVEEEVDCGDYVRRLVTYAAEPGARVPAYLLIPRQAFSSNQKLPAMLTLHQTH